MDVKRKYNMKFLILSVVVGSYPCVFANENNWKCSAECNYYEVAPDTSIFNRTERLYSGAPSTKSNAKKEIASQCATLSGRIVSEFICSDSY